MAQDNIKYSTTPYVGHRLSRTVFFGSFSYKTPLKFRTSKVRKFERNILKSKQCIVFVFRLILHFLKMESKRKLQTRTLTEKYDILKEIDNGKKCATAIRDHNVPKQTLYG